MKKENDTVNRLTAYLGKGRHSNLSFANKPRRRFPRNRKIKPKAKVAKEILLI